MKSHPCLPLIRGIVQTMPEQMNDSQLAVTVEWSGHLFVQALRRLPADQRHLHLEGLVDRVTASDVPEEQMAMNLETEAA